jgi:hypothetical protein
VTDPGFWPLPLLAPTPTPGADIGGWVTVVDDEFNTGGLQSHWTAYDGRYGSGPRNCAIPSHDFVSGGSLHLMMSYENSRTLPCGAGWYTGGLALTGYSSVDQRITVRFRVVAGGVVGHFVIPMRWPDIDSSWPAAGEEDYCERDAAGGCATYLHYAGNAQKQHAYEIDTSQWHTVRFARRDGVVSAFIDDMSTPVWTYAGAAGTLPRTLKHVVLQQECQISACPSGRAGTEDIQVDWITVENPA